MKSERNGPMRLSLVPVDGSPPIPLDKAILFLGRGQECDVIITNSRKVSRKHCCVAQINGQVVVRDLASMNGVRINETLVVKQAGVNVNDLLWVGDVGYQLTPQGLARARSQQFQSPQAADSAGRGSRFPVAPPVSEQHVTQDEEVIEIDDSDILE